MGTDHNEGLIMLTIKAWIQQLFLVGRQEDEDNAIIRTIRQLNYRRIFTFSIVAAVFEGGLVILYDIPQLVTDMGDRTLSYLYLFLHIWMFMVAISNLIRLHIAKNNWDAKEHEHVAYTTVILGMSAMAGVGILDFITLGQLTAYTTILMACGITLLIRPPYNYIAYGIPQLFLTIGIILVGHNSDKMIATLMNGAMFFVCVVIITTIQYNNQKNYITQNLRLTYLSNYDSLTGLINRRFFEQSMELRMEQEEQSACLVILDIDDFKKVNDIYGHRAGDQVLTEMSRILSESVREKDLVARWGGEEFIILLMGVSLSEGEVIVERIRKDVQQLGIPWEDRTIHVTASFGITKLSGNDSKYYDDFFQKADAGLYEAKVGGKNQYVVK